MDGMPAGRSISPALVLVVPCLVVAASAHAVTEVGGEILIDTIWGPESAPYQVIENVVVRHGATLTIRPGVRVELGPSHSIYIIESGALIAEGTADSSITFARLTSQRWGTIGGVNAEIILRHCLIEWGSHSYFITLHDGMLSNAGGATVVEDCTFVRSGLDAVEFQGGSVVFRRNTILTCERQGYNGWGGSIAIIEDNRVEGSVGDAFDLTGVSAGELTFRDNLALDVGDDGLDIDGWEAGEIGGFEAHGVADKGLSVSLGSTDVVASNMIVSDCREAYTVTNNSNLRIVNCVAYRCERGLSAYERVPHYGGGRLTATNSIVWDVEEPVFVDSLSYVWAFFSIVDTDTIYPGLGNSNRDPLFVAPPARDFRLRDGSPAIDAGLSTGAPRFDIRGNPRVDHPGIPDRGAGTETYFDLGAHEFDPAAPAALAARDRTPGFLALRAFPSPARGKVGITFELEAGDHTELAVYDAAGRLVERLFSGPLASGRHTFAWNPTAERVASGVYLVRLRAGADSQMIKVVCRR